MKKILITGANSYIGTSLEKWLGKFPNKYFINTVSTRNDCWRNINFSGYDVVFHVAGIAHIKETKKNQNVYYQINRDLAYANANKAKAEGVNQFIFLSSMSVYGIENGVINKNSTLSPKSHYGKSKLQAEELIRPLDDGKFKVAILRPPMIYGKGCKGNYPRLANLAIRIPLFPDINNKRSMIFIYNLCEFVRLLIDDCDSGLFLPQNSEYITTSGMVRLIAEVHKKKIIITKLFNPILMLFKSSTIKKIFGDLVYDKQLSCYKQNYNLFDLKNSIFITESKE